MYANAVGPADKKPNAVVETTSAERRALDSSVRLERFDFCGGKDDDDVVVVSLLSSVFVASFDSLGPDCVELILALSLSSCEVSEKKT